MTVQGVSAKVWSASLAPVAPNSRSGEAQVGPNPQGPSGLPTLLSPRTGRQSPPGGPSGPLSTAGKGEKKQRQQFNLLLTKWSVWGVGLEVEAGSVAQQ